MNHKIFKISYLACLLLVVGEVEQFQREILEVRLSDRLKH